MFVNWKRNRDWSDLQTARFYSLIDGNHDLNHGDESEAVRIIGCSRAELMKMISRLKSATYVYPLQMWKHPYSIFEVNTITPLVHPEGFLNAVSSILASVPASYEEFLRFKYIISNHVENDDPSLMNMLQGSGIFGILHSSKRTDIV